ncbi:MAG: NAD(P)H-binding protein, partial [Bacteroidota bacterium]
MPFLLYGATGYTGRLIADLAVARGHRPVLGGRTEATLRPLAERLGLDPVVVSLDDARGLDRALEGVDAVLHAAGPFAQTSAPMVDACLRTGTPY